MTENFINVPQTGKVKDEFALKKDKQKAYQIFFLSGIASIILTSIMFLL